MLLGHMSLLEPHRYYLILVFVFMAQNSQLGGRTAEQCKVQTEYRVCDFEACIHPLRAALPVNFFFFF